MTLTVGLLFRRGAARSSLSPSIEINTVNRIRAIAMFRITTRGADGELVLTLEGNLTGPWVDELNSCWHTVVAAAPGAQVRVDLSSVCRVDSEGRELLRAMHRSGARLVARGCVMPVLVREIAEDEQKAVLVRANAKSEGVPRW
jgi:ABC-type transporter Mla MlaB component